jgi:hypothetical protein
LERCCRPGKVELGRTAFSEHKGGAVVWQASYTNERPVAVALTVIGRACALPRLHFADKTNGDNLGILSRCQSLAAKVYEPPKVGTISKTKAVDARLVFTFATVTTAGPPQQTCAEIHLFGNSRIARYVPSDNRCRQINGDFESVYIYRGWEYSFYT